jgi:ribosomal protein L22
MGSRGMRSTSAKAGKFNSESLDVTEKYKGMTLKQAENALRKIQDHEEAVIFDKDMNVVKALSGESGSITFPNDLKKKEGITVTHNHPSGLTGYGAVFSPDDVSWFTTSKATEIRAVASGKGEYVYSLQVRGRQSSRKTKNEKKQLNKWAHSVEKDVLPKAEGGTGKLISDFNSFYRQFRNQGKSENSAKRSAWQKATGIIEKSLEDTVKSLGKNAGAIYYSKNKKYNVNR